MLLPRFPSYLDLKQRFCHRPFQDCRFHGFQGHQWLYHERLSSHYPTPHLQSQPLMRSWFSSIDLLSSKARRLVNPLRDGLGLTTTRRLFNDFCCRLSGHQDIFVVWQDNDVAGAFNSSTALTKSSVDGFIV